MSEMSIAARRQAAENAAKAEDDYGSVDSYPWACVTAGIEAANRVELTDELCEQVRNNSTLRHLWVHEVRLILAEFCDAAGFEVIQ